MGALSRSVEGSNDGNYLKSGTKTCFFELQAVYILLSRSSVAIPESMNTILTMFSCEIEMVSAERHYYPLKYDSHLCSSPYAAKRPESVEQ